jgi:hypothetical protein
VVPGENGRGGVEVYRQGVDGTVRGGGELRELSLEVAGDAESVVVVVAEGEVEVVEAASKVPVFATEGERAVAGMQVGACVGVEIV